MFFVKLKVFVLSLIVVIIFSVFVLYELDIYIKNNNAQSMSSQLNYVTQSIFSSAKPSSTGDLVHNYSLIDLLERNPLINRIWVGSNGAINTPIKSYNQTLKDVIERKVYISKQEEVSSYIIENTNDTNMRISFPIIAVQNCSACHAGIKSGDVVGTLNARMILPDNMIPIFRSMKVEFIIVILIASFILALNIDLATRIFSRFTYDIRTVIRDAIDGNFTTRMKNEGAGIFNETIRITNTLLNVLDKSINAIDAKIATIFIYKKSLYSQNPLIRITELIAELTNLFNFKTKIENSKNTREVYKELQYNLSKYIKYQSIIFIEVSNGGYKGGYKIENKVESMVTESDIEGIYNRLSESSSNVLLDDKKGCLFISTSSNNTHVIDLKIFISNDTTVYYSMFMASKKDLLEKENSVSRIYNYIREAKPIINNIILIKSIEEASYTDPLTKAYNRLYLEKYIPMVEGKLESDISFGILMIDIDHFKKVNDTYGHHVGDGAIVLLTESVRKSIRRTDKLFRYGGEEFLVVLENVDFDTSNSIAEKIRTTFVESTQCSMMEITFKKSCSIGVSMMPMFTKNIWDCINQADLALYNAKESGRNRVVKYHDGMAKPSKK